MSAKTYFSHRWGGTVDLTNRRIYFWKGPFSQWERVPIYDPSLSKTANCAEQLMMAHKAITFNDFDAMEKIFGTTSPREQKAIGRQINGYVDQQWSDVRLEVVTAIQVLKFTATPDLTDILLSTIGMELVEASPEDCIWGVGLKQDDPAIWDSNNWKGQNLLGKALMEARNRIIDTL